VIIFFNFDTSLLRRGLHVAKDDEKPIRNLHGILGQTVLYKKYNNRWRYLEGDIDQYRVENILGHDDEYSLINVRDEE